MTYIELTDDQVRVLLQTSNAIELRDSHGQVLGRVGPPSEEEIIAHIKRQRALKLPRYPAEAVEARLHALQEIREREGMDANKMWAVLEQLRKGNGGRVAGFLIDRQQACK